VVSARDISVFLSVLTTAPAQRSGAVKHLVANESAVSQQMPYRRVIDQGSALLDAIKTKSIAITV
jgi:hypothetical protein